MSSSKWKGFEKRVADAFNTLRTPFSGSNSGVTSSDSLHDKIYIECKYHKETSILKLMKSTEEKGKGEQKTAILALGDPEDAKKEIYVMFNIKDLYKLIREVDLSEVDDRLPEGTTIYKLVESSSSENRSLLDIQEQLNVNIKQLIRDSNVITNDSLSEIKALSALSNMIDNVIEYGKDVEEEDLDESEETD